MIVSEWICLLTHYPTVTPYHHDYILICSDGFTVFYLVLWSVVRVIYIYIVVIKLQAKLIVNIWDLFLAITPYKWVLILGGKSIFKPDFIMSYYRV